MQRILITGANRGIGFEFVRQLAERGDRVFATCRCPDQADDLQMLANHNPEQISIAALDVTDQASIYASYRLIVKQTDSLDLLINNAGIFPRAERLGNLDADDILEAFRVNSVAPLMVAQRYINLLKVGTNPRIVSISSQLGSLARKRDGRDYSYCASKAALNMLTRTLAFGLREEGIIAVVMHPGWVQTDMGGANASLPPERSVAGLLKVIDQLTMKDTGCFLQWDGGELPW